MGGEGSGKPKAELLKLNGTQLDHIGKVTPTDFFKFLALPAEHNANLEKVMTPEQALKFRNHIVRMKVGTSAMIPMLCGGDRCPVKQCPFHDKKNWPIAEQCHPPGTYIKVAGDRDIKIEDLDPEEHKVVSFHRKKHRIMSNWRNGYDFTVSSKAVVGELVDINAGFNYYQATLGHICVARFNEKAINKFCVYLMKKGSHWRIGKSRISAITTSPEGDKYRLPFTYRGVKEEADAMWVLGIYDLNTDALLAEESFSIKWQTSKVSFADSLDRIKSKYDGLYKWATKEQINAYHDSLSNSEDFYKEKLGSIGLRLEYPIWEKDNSDKRIGQVKLYARNTMFIRACNLISGIMEVPLYIKDTSDTSKVIWNSIKVTRQKYSGLVYALDVKNKHKTYFANNIATHNCPIEATLIAAWTQSYIEDIGVQPDERTEMILINKLVECDMIDYRANIGLSKDEDGWNLIKVDIIDNGESQQEVSSLHPLLEAKSKAHAERMRVLESFSATRKEKAKKAAMLKQREEGDIGQHWADIKTALTTAKKIQHGGSLEEIKEDAKDVASSDFVQADWEIQD